MHRVAEEAFRPGTLYVCATPLGNLGDLTERARAALAVADVVAAERPVHTRKLLQHLGVPLSKLRPAADSTPEPALRDIIDVLRGGGTVVAVTDAGTPGVSDPGSRLVKLAYEAGCCVSPLPGPSALTAALSICGFDTRRVLMEGFLPRKRGPRREALSRALETDAAIVLFESPHRVEQTLHDLADLAPERPLLLLREATKLHEQTLRGTARELLTQIGDAPRGEVTIVIAPPTEGIRNAMANHELESQVACLLREGLSSRDVVRALMVLAGLPKSQAFALVRRIDRNPGTTEGDS